MKSYKRRVRRLQEEEGFAWDGQKVKEALRGRKGSPNWPHCPGCGDKMYSAFDPGFDGRQDGRNIYICEGCHAQYVYDTDFADRNVSRETSDIEEACQQWYREKEK